ncbi:MAG: hypothetical protein AMXMBFR4_16170 [Candidatus Hydrogenedentota bacterium]
MLAYLEKMTPSERRLAALAAAVALTAVVVLVVLRALDRIDTLDATIDGLEQELLALTEQAAAAEPIEIAYRSMADQHSSQWTQEEIHDRLRIEITRLSLRDVPPEGQPLPATAGGAAALVDIRSMPMGALASGPGYRSYQISFKTEPAPIQNVATFLQRLQQSPQALRVDSLEIVRHALSDTVTASVRVTRTVIGDAATLEPPGARAIAEIESGNIARNPGFEEWDGAASTPSEWVIEDLRAVKHTDGATEGAASLRVESTAQAGAVYQEQQLQSGSLYELSFDARAWGSARAMIGGSPDGPVFDTGQPLIADGAPYRYRLRFQVPGAGGERVPIRAPSIVIEGAGGAVLIDNVILTEKKV